MTGSAISGLAVTMSAADTRFTFIANIARENHYGGPLCLDNLLLGMVAKHPEVYVRFCKIIKIGEQVRKISYMMIN